ncbi:MAG: hypothetical protein ABL895_12420 [Cyclobacteriaceae bacterium]
MKKSLWLVLLLMSTTLQLCTDESENLAPEKVQFTCVFTGTGNDGGRMQSTELPAALLISMENNVGVPLFTLREIKLLRIGDSFMTEPLEFLQGYYKITDFLLVDDSSKVLYATPKNGSTLAKAVVRPLPYGFNVTKNKIINVEMEVIDVSQRLPEEFGYASFGINAVNPLRLSVFTTVGTTTNLATANAYILKGTDTLKSYTLGATVNLISFKGDVADTYKLVVVKEGYNTYSKEFVYSELIAMLGSLPLKVYLIPATFNILAFVDENSTPANGFKFIIDGLTGEVMVDWGDGGHEGYSINMEEFGFETVEISHTYAIPGNHSITITGDLDLITSLFTANYGEGRMSAINVQGLTGLEEIVIGLNEPPGPAVIDLSNNSKLHYVNVNHDRHLNNLILPTENNIRAIEISGCDLLTTPRVDDVISKIYFSVVQHNEMNGDFSLSEDWSQDPGDPMVGPPSPASITKLRELRDIYQWRIVPDPL